MKAHLTCLGIESTAHTFAAAVVTSKGTILSDVRDMYQSDTHGIIPNHCAQHHLTVKDHIIHQALQTLTAKKINLIAYSAAPGIAPCLHVGKNVALTLGKELDAPVIGVNHSVAHLTSGQLLTGANDPIFLYISGANTQIIAIEDNHFRIFGETLDIAAGNALDKFARELRLGFPGGPKIEQLATTGTYVELPYTVKGMDLSFSGLITKATHLAKQGTKTEDLCYSLQETMFAMLTEVTERALAHTGKTETLLIGGVAANQRLCAMLTTMCHERNATFYAVPLKYAADNAAMIAWQGILEHHAGRRDEHPNIRPYERTDQVPAIWQHATTTN